MSTAKKVIIVGAGLSGLAAAKELKFRGYNVKVLEARERIGGRVHSNTVGDSGAMFVHGVDNNPLTKLARDLSIRLEPYEDCMLYDASGWPVEEYVDKKCQRLFNKLLTLARSGLPEGVDPSSLPRKPIIQPAPPRKIKMPKKVKLAQEPIPVPIVVKKKKKRRRKNMSPDECKACRGMHRAHTCERARTGQKRQTNKKLKRVEVSRGQSKSVVQQSSSRRGSSISNIFGNLSEDESDSGVPRKKVPGEIDSRQNNDGSTYLLPIDHPTPMSKEDSQMLDNLEEDPPRILGTLSRKYCEDGPTILKKASTNMESPPSSISCSSTNTSITTADSNDIMSNNGASSSSTTTAALFSVEKTPTTPAISAGSTNDTASSATTSKRTTRGSKEAKRDTRGTSKRRGHNPKVDNSVGADDCQVSLGHVLQYHSNIVASLTDEERLVLEWHRANLEMSNGLLIFSFLIYVKSYLTRLISFYFFCFFFFSRC